ncbi:MAG: recombinase family protein, partial [Bacillota bacterium]
EESRSISENTRWGIVRKFEQGIPTMHMKTLFGYAEAEDGGVIIEESEAEIVRFMYKKYLDGWSGNRIAKELEVREIKTSTGKSKWNSTTILSMLQNEKYCGDCLLQKTYTVDYLTKKRSKNRGECDVFYVENHHVPIVEKAIFQDVQTEIYRRKSARKGSVKNPKMDMAKIKVKK